MRKYELAVLLHPDLELDLDPALTRIAKLVGNAGGQVGTQDNWGKQKLAYPVKKQAYGIYVFYRLELEPTAVNQLNENLYLDDSIMRHLLVALDEKELAAVAQSTSSKDNKETTKE